MKKYGKIRYQTKMPPDPEIIYELAMIFPRAKNSKTFEEIGI